MARVRPFRAWRYARPEVDLSAVAAPPYDVVSEAQRIALITGDPTNVVALELPEGPLDPTLPNNRYQQGKATWDEWRSTGVLVQDAHDTLYVLEQRFVLDGKPVSRRAFIVEISLEPFDAGVVIPHERTLPKALGDRFELISATGANLSQVFGMFEDTACDTDALFDSVMAQTPISRATDADGVESVLWASTDPSHAEALTSFMASRRVFIADGHHRYTVALAYRDARRAQAAGAGEPPTEPAYDSVMMALVNMDDPDLAVLPYHRIADKGSGFDSAAFYAALSGQFVVTAVAPQDAAELLAAQTNVAFLIKTRDDEQPRLAVLRDEIDLDTAIALDRSAAWKSLDVSVLQELVLWPLLNVHPDHPETLERMSFTKDAEVAFAATAKHDVGFVLRPTRLDQLRAVSLGGETMPQKSTYFYPKLLSGLVMRSAE